MISKPRLIIVLALFALTWYVLQSTSGVMAVPIKKPLSAFPQRLDGYSLANSFQSSSEVVELLGVDDYIQYNYEDSAKQRINLYVGYYKAVGVTGAYHSPKNCIPGGGWGIDSVKKVDLQIETEGAKNTTVSQMLIRNGANYQVVLYWYQNRGRIIASEYWEKIFQVVDALVLGRRDGAFIRIMANVPGNDVGETEARLKRFAEKVLPRLEEHLPGRQL